MNLHKLIFTNNACYKAGRRITPKGIIVHSTGANNPWLKRYVGPDDGLLGKNQYNNHWNQPMDREVCVHAFIGKLADGTVATYQTLPWDYRGWHCAGSGNDTHISFEICEDDLTDAAYKIEKGRVTVDPEKAAVVREVFRRALEGKSLTSLAIDLNRRGFTGVLGGKWNSMRIREMLSNEKYLGNALLQKQYRNNHLEKKEIPNRGELPQYYAEGTHEAIIDQATFDAAQELLAGITENSPVKRPRRRSAFTSMITCTVCGRNYKRCTGGKRHFWNCPTAVQTDLPSCGTSQIPEKLLYDLAAQVLGLAQFDEGVFLERVKGIDALPDKTLVFHFYDGSTAERHWEHISRAKSWTPEMKEIARQRALAQRRGEKWQEL